MNVEERATAKELLEHKFLGKAKTTHCLAPYIKATYQKKKGLIWIWLEMYVACLLSVWLNVNIERLINVDQIQIAVASAVDLYLFTF